MIEGWDGLFLRMPTSPFAKEYLMSSLDLTGQHQGFPASYFPERAAR